MSARSFSGCGRTGFHNWERRAPSDRALTDAWLTEKIKQIHDVSRGVYGVPRIHAELRMEHDVRVGRKRFARLMKAAGITGIRPRKRFKTTIRIPGITPAIDLVERQFRPTLRTRCGSLTSPTCGPARAGCTSPRCRTRTRGRSSS
jgi:transposase InsO family protein